MLERGHDRDFAERVFEQIKGFGEYGFPESHSASFALLVYISAWLKRHEPAAFYCGILNSLPMGFYSPAQLVKDATAHGIDVRPADVQVSGWDHRLETPLEPVAGYRRPQPALRIGLRRVKGLHEEAGRRVEEAQPYRDIDELTATGRPRRPSTHLSGARWRPEDAVRPSLPGALGCRRRRSPVADPARDRALSHRGRP